MSTLSPAKEFDWKVMGDRYLDWSTLAHTLGKLQVTRTLPRTLQMSTLPGPVVPNEDKGIKMFKVLQIIANIYSSKSLRTS